MINHSQNNKGFAYTWQIFMTCISEAKDLLIKNWQLIFGISLAAQIIILLIDIFIFPIFVQMFATLGLLAFGLLSLTMILIGSLISIYVYGLIVRLIKLTNEGHKIDVQKEMLFVKDTFTKVVKLLINVLIYNKGWIILAYIAVVVVLGANILSQGSLADAGITITLIALLPVVAIVYLIIFIKPIVNSSLAVMLFYLSESPDEKKPLDDSIAILDKHLVLSIGVFALLMFSLIFVSILFSIALTPIFAALDLISFNHSYMGMSGNIVDTLIQAALLPFSVAFLYRYYKSLKKGL